MFLHTRFPSTYATLCFRELGYLQNSGYFPLELCPKFWTWKIWLWRVHRHRARYKQATTVGLLFVTPVDDGERRNSQVWSTIDDDRWLLITLGVQLCVQHDGRLGMMHRHAGPLVQLILTVVSYTGQTQRQLDTQGVHPRPCVRVAVEFLQIRLESFEALSSYPIPPPIRSWWKYVVCLPPPRQIPVYAWMGDVAVLTVHRAHGRRSPTVLLLLHRVDCQHSHNAHVSRVVSI